jgi:glycosyltransferase involved in cell wall biosynthesis
MRFYKPVQHLFLRRAHKIIVTSPNLLEASTHLAPYRDKSGVIPFGIDLDESGQTVERKIDLGISPQDRVVLFVGRLS